MPLPPGHSRLLRRHVLAVNEQVLLETHPSKWWYFFWPSVALGLLLLADLLTYSGVYHRIPFAHQISTDLDKVPLPSGFPSWLSTFTAISVVLYLVLAVWVLFAILRWINQTYVVTDSRLIEQIGIIRHTIQEIPLRQVRDILVYQRTLVGRILRYGNLQFKTLLEVDQRKAQAIAHWAERHFDPRGEFWYAPDRPEATMTRREFRSRALAVRESLMRVNVEQESGVEWWIGLPNPFLIERTVEGLLRPPATAPS